MSHFLTNIPRFNDFFPSPSGIETRPGRGRYRDTHIITVSPRFQIDNRSSHRLLMSQLHFADSFVSGRRRLGCFDVERLSWS